MSVDLDARYPSRVELITPEAARQYLAQAEGIKQRRLRNRKVDLYAQLMRAGRWYVSNDAIAFSRQGQLMNGQHRLNAVILSGEAVPFLVVRRLEPEAYAVFDRPERRTVADYLHQWLPEHLNKSVTNLAALIRAILRYERFGTFTSAGSADFLDFQEALDFALEHGEELHEILARTQRKGLWNLAATGTTLGALYYHFSKADEMDADEFFIRLGSGTGLPEGSPILVLRDKLLTFQREAGARPKQNYMAALTIIAWNKWREAETVRDLQWRAGGTTNEPFPAIR